LRLVTVDVEHVDLALKATALEKTPVFSVALSLIATASWPLTTTLLSSRT